MMRKILAFIALFALCHSAAFGQAGTTNWAGMEVNWDGTNPVTQIQGCQRVPQIQIGSSNSKNNIGAAWEGVGGFNGTSGIGQAGVIYQITTSGAITYEPFYAFGTGGVQPIVETVNANEINCVLFTCTANCVANATNASISLTMNECQNTVSSANCLAGTGALWTYTNSFTGKHTDLESAEWISETTTETLPTTLWNTPNFGYVPFENNTYTENGVTTTPSFVATTNGLQMGTSTGWAFPSSGYGAGNNSFVVCGSPGPVPPCPGPSQLNNYQGRDMGGF